MTERNIHPIEFDNAMLFHAARRPVFAKRVLDDLLARIGALTPLDDGQHDQVLSVAEVCQRHGGRTDEVTRAVLAGEILAFRVPGKPRLHAIRVCVSDLLAARPPATGDSGDP